jgi:hypothetical protein
MISLYVPHSTPMYQNTTIRSNAKQKPEIERDNQQTDAQRLAAPPLV